MDEGVHIDLDTNIDKDIDMEIHIAVGSGIDRTTDI